MPFIIRSEEIAYNEIKQRILSGRLAPGGRLVHRTLAKELGMSAIPVLLALRMLERDGLVSNTPGLGATVRQWTQEEIIDLYQIRAFIESLAARLCAERATTANLEEICNAEKAFAESIDSHDSEDNIRADINLHVAIVRGAHCFDLERMTETLAIIHCSMRAFGLSLKIPRLMSAANKELHAPLVQAILKKDPKAAEREGRVHVEQSLARNLAWVERVSAAMANKKSLRVRLRTKKPRLTFHSIGKNQSIKTESRPK